MFQWFAVGRAGGRDLTLGVALDGYIGREMIDALSAFVIEKGFADDHSLCQQTLERLVKFNNAHVTHHLCPKAGVYEVHDGMVVAPDILIDGRPIRRGL